MFRLALALIVVCLSSTATATDVQVRAVEVVAYGIFDSRDLGRRIGNRAHAPGADSVTGVRFTDFTAEIPAELGTAFGFQYVINSTPKGGRMDVTQIIRFPGEGIRLPGGRTYQESIEDVPILIGEKHLHGYAFDVDGEIVPGDWTFEVWHNDAPLVRKTFTVVPAE